MLREPRATRRRTAPSCCRDTPEADAGFVIMDPGIPPLRPQRSASYGAARTGLNPDDEPVTDDARAPAGLIRVALLGRYGKVTQVAFRNVPAFAVHLDAAIEVPTLGRVTVDVAWGGMFYVIADAAPFGLRLTPDEGRDITRIGELIKAATQEQLPVVHPENPEIKDVTIAQLSGPPASTANHRRNAVVVSTGTRLDRPPRGPGDRPVAVRHGHVRENGDANARGLLRSRAVQSRGRAGDGFTESCSRKRRSVRTARRPDLAVTAWINGFAQYVVDPQDPFPKDPSATSGEDG